MKRLFVIMLSLPLCISLSACMGDTAETENNEKTFTEPSILLSMMAWIMFNGKPSVVVKNKEIIDEIIAMVQNGETEKEIEKWKML